MKKANENSGNSSEDQLDKLIKLGQAMKLMEQVIMPVPSRPTLISYIKNRVLNGKVIFNNYYVYESSLNEFIEKNRRNF